MRISTEKVGLHPLPVRLSYLVLAGLVSCAKADPPEMFVADPALMDDFTSNLPATGSSLGFEYAIVQGIAIYEGDIMLGQVDSTGSLASRFEARGVAKTDLFSRWPNGVVVYQKPTGSSTTQQENIEKAMAHWMEHTTISFVERTEENKDQHPHYIKFLDTQSCASHVGMIGEEQPIYLSDACSVGSVIHEIGHAIGLFHEHTRPDRDNFVQIDWNEIVNGKDINFKLQTAGIDTYSAYDYGSIMHYGRDFFSKSGGPTIIVADNVEIGQREALSPLDIQSVNNMYESDLELATPLMQSVDGVIEIDVTAYNVSTSDGGSRAGIGAHDIELILRLGDDSTWVSVPTDSEWDCLAFGPELNCARAIFPSQTESSFTVKANLNSATADDLAAILLSRTQDKNPSNNSYNDDNVQWQSIGEDLTSATPLDKGQQQTPAASPPDEDTTTTASPTLLAAAQSRSSENSAQKTVANDSGGGGSMQLYMLAMLATITGIRRRRTRSCE